ncbi:MAG TPA: hypothetical protein VKV30_15525, partial [Candidatus Angelobacter sp.]|nr:hypothetical protein [Candidatus Angelobacter sp.]
MHALSSSAIIFDTVVKSTLLLAIAWGAALILKKRSAATQHMVRAFALAALLLLPFSVMLVPAWHIKGLPQYPKNHPAMQQSLAQHVTITTSPAPQRTAAAAPAKRAVVSAESANFRSKREDGAARPRKLQFVASTNSSGIAPEISPLPAETRSIEPSGEATSSTRLIPTYVPKLLLGLWIVGSLFFLARWRLNAMRLAALVRRANVLTDSGWN